MPLEKSFRKPQRLGPCKEQFLSLLNLFLSLRVELVHSIEKRATNSRRACSPAPPRPPPLRRPTPSRLRPSHLAAAHPPLVRSPPASCPTPSPPRPRPRARLS